MLIRLATRLSVIYRLLVIVISLRRSLLAFRLSVGRAGIQSRLLTLGCATLLGRVSRHWRMSGSIALHASWGQLLVLQRRGCVGRVSGLLLSILGYIYRLTGYSLP